jgi:hypothetical protein
MSAVCDDIVAARSLGLICGCESGLPWRDWRRICLRMPCPLLPQAGHLAGAQTPAPADYRNLPCSLFGAQSVLGSLAHSQTSINAGRLFGGVCCVIGRAKHNAARNEGVRLVAQGVNQDTAGLQDTITSDYVWMCAGVGGVKRRQTAGVDDRPARRGACVKSVGRLR